MFKSSIYLMRHLPRLLFILGLAYVCVILFREGKRIDAQETADKSRLFLIFGGALVCAVLAGIVTAVTWLPEFGEKIGEMIYGSSEQETSDPITHAHEKVADGEYLEAISLYRTALAVDPDDTAAMGEIADVQARHLGDPNSAVELLENALQKHWPPDEETFLRCKLAEMHGRYLGDMTRARQLLLETIEDYPDSAHAQRAQRLLMDLESGSPSGGMV